ncbi:hypothetical protein WR25_01001 [Diploscapter pachys]|uniref:Uncharacterized protein n=1 Tax=Diploscapter pachys TaxID=2018661 RepID=A0A2A2LGG0_9BILA|nr:hypothetical protein WR25_01001 [Diploscapter pachys]
MKVNVERTGKEEEGRGKGVAGMKQGKQGKCRQRQKWEEGRTAKKKKPQASGVRKKKPGPELGKRGVEQKQNGLTD